MDKKTVEMNILTDEIKDTREELTTSKNDDSNLLEELKKKEGAVKQLEKERDALERERLYMKSELKKLDEEPSLTQKQSKKPTREAKSIEEDQKLAEDELDLIHDKLESRYEKLNKRLINVDAVKSKLDRMSILKAGGDDSEARLKENRKAMDKMIKELEATIEKLKKENETVQYDIGTYQMNLKDLGEEVTALNEDLETTLEEYDKIRKQKEEVVVELTELNVKNIEFKRKHLVTHKNLQERRKELEVLFKNIDLSTYFNLLEETAKLGIDGVYGLLIDLLDIPNLLLGACNSLILYKLFSLVVDSQETANRVIEINKGLKGGYVNMHVVDWVKEAITEDKDDEEAAREPMSDETVLLDKYIRVKEEKQDLGLETVVAHIVKGNAMVETIYEARTLAADFNLNCYTEAGEIVYKGGGVSRLGYSDTSIDKLLLYVEYVKIKQEFDKLEKKAQDFGSSVKTLKEQELALTKQCENMELVRERKSTEIKAKLAQESTLRGAIIQLNKRFFENKKEAKNLDTERRMTVKHINIIDDTDVIYSKQEFDQLRAKAEEKAEACIDLKKEISELEKQKIELETKLDKYREEMLDTKAAACDYRLAEFNADILERELADRAKLRDKVSKKLKDIDIKITELEGERSLALTEVDAVRERSEQQKRILAGLQKDMLQKNQKRLDFQRVIDKYEDKIHSLDCDNALLRKNQGSSDKKLIKMLNKLLKETKRKYTEKDRLNFETLDDHFSSCDRFEDQIEAVKQSKEHFQDLIGECQFSSILNFFGNFGPKFWQLFSYFV